MDAKAIIEEFQDLLAPKLDVYEQAVYLYILRHSRLQGREEVTIGFFSARLRMALGIVANLQLLRSGNLRPNITNIGPAQALEGGAN